MNKHELILLGFCIAVGTAVVLTTPKAEARTINLTIDHEMVYDQQTETNLREIQTTNADDNIVITINSPGGEVSVLMAYQAAIEHSGAHFTARVSDLAASAAASLLCLADTREISPVAIIMFHQAYQINQENGARERAPDFVRSYIDLILRNKCTYLITEDEIDSIDNRGADVFLTGAEENDRLTKYVIDHTKGYNPVGNIIGDSK